VLLVSVESLAEALAVSPRAALHLLKALSVPTLRMPPSSKSLKHRYFNQVALERALFAILDVGGPGYPPPRDSELPDAYFQTNKARRALKDYTELTKMHRSSVQDTVLRLVHADRVDRRDPARVLREVVKRTTRPAPPARSPARPPTRALVSGGPDARKGTPR